MKNELGGFGSVKDANLFPILHNEMKSVKH